MEVNENVAKCPVENRKNRTQTGHRSSHQSAGKAAKTEVAYWRARVRPRIIRGEATAFYYARLFDGSREAWLCLDTPNRDAAARLARDHWLRMRALGSLERLLTELAPAPPPKPTAMATVGELLAQARALAVPGRLRPRSFALCEAALRKISSGIVGFDGNASRFDYRRGGSARWRERIDAISLSVITKDAVERWRNAFISQAGNDLARRESRARSASSYIRCCRSLLSQKLLPDLRARLVLPDPSPFAAVQLVESVRPFEARVDAVELYERAWRELRDEPDLLTAFCLLAAGGLRRAEADLLPWAHVDMATGALRVDSTPFFQPKSRQSRRTVRLPSDVVALLKERRAITGVSPFVLGGGTPRGATRCNSYRADAWRPLSRWLRRCGIDSRTPLHELRKLAGSLINTQGGLEAARRFLGHRDIKTTIASYVHIVPLAVDFTPRNRGSSSSASPPPLRNATAVALNGDRGGHDRDVDPRRE